MAFRFFQVDAFASAPFTGNPAAVVLLPQFLPDDILMAVAAENNLSETAFLVVSNAEFHLRWFTPLCEVPLCGHATLATAAVVMERVDPSRSEVVFATASGPLPVRRSGAGYVMNFPSRPSVKLAEPPSLLEAIGVNPLSVFENTFNYMAILESADAVRNCHPNFQSIERLDRPGLIITARGDGGTDFISRYFAPQKGISEDPVTGGAHCMLTPYWASELGKTDFRAYQASSRGGEILCRLRDDRVELEGKCHFVIEGTIAI